MKEVILGGRRLRLDPAKAIGTGGEADVYDIGAGMALKVYKGPDHPDYRGLPEEQTAARDRLSTRAAKLRDFPRMLPPKVVVPLELATDRSGALAGYAMRLVPEPEPILRWAEPVYRRAVPPALVGPLFLDLHGTLSRVHEAGAVVGDFNDLNVLVSGGAAYLPSERALRRVTVLDTRVRAPKASLPWKVLPDELLQRFYETFHQDQRSAFPRPLLEGIRWTRCEDCKTVHARNLCPTCSLAGSVGRRLTVTVRGRVTATVLFKTDGEIVAVGPEGWLVFEGGQFMREDGTRALRGALRPGTRYFLHGRGAVAVRRGEAYACAGGKAWWERDGALWREGSLGDERVGEVLAGQTRLWAGPDFGFGFYRAGGVTVAFVFDAVRRGILDGIPLPRLRGRVLDADCVFGEERAWLFLELESGGRVFKRCVVISRDGKVRAAADAPPWLESIHGACAAGAFLFVPTDAGIVRVDETLTQTTEYSETEPFVDAGSRLAAAGDGMIVAGPREILKLAIKQEARI